MRNASAGMLGAIVLVILLFAATVGVIAAFSHPTLPNHPATQIEQLVEEGNR